ncbi:hypothetical protein KDK82_2025 [Delftia sp. K82]|nr:hypothetical protein KDK82_2025 [Delftia sp. K82]
MIPPKVLNNINSKRIFFADAFKEDIDIPIDCIKMKSWICYKIIKNGMLFRLEAVFNVIPNAN